MNDKCFFETEDFFVVSEGVILNKNILLDQYGSEQVFDLIIQMYKSDGDSFFNKYRGSFSGALYDKALSKWIIYTNHYGDNVLFYSFINGHFIVASQMDWIIQTFNLNNIDISFDQNAFDSICTYGYMSNDITYLNETKRLLPGFYMVYKNGIVDFFKYYSLKPGKYDLCSRNESEIIDELDILFRNAIKQEYDKDKEYGYAHLSQLSGGLDSRMNVWVAKCLGYNDITCMTFAQKNSLDDLISKDISNDLRLNRIVWHLDSAKHLFKIDEYISLNYGLAIYGGIGAEIEILDNLDNNIGILHTGQIGDVIVGSFLNSEKELNDFSPGGLYSSIFEAPEIDVSSFFDREDYLIFVRGFMGCLCSHLFTRNYTEVASPFLNIDFLDYCLSIPISLRRKHYIYKKWIIKKYPEAANYVWEKTKKKITCQTNDFQDKFTYLIKNPKLILRKFGFKIKIDNKIMTGMNPMDLWWENNPEFRRIYDDYFEKIIKNDIIPDLYKRKFSILYTSGNVIDKMLCITCLASINYYLKYYK
jgi:asparagine synthase (glutamine-hydrolysing)